MSSSTICSAQCRVYLYCHRYLSHVIALRHLCTVNFFGTVAITQAFLPLLRAQQYRSYHSRIINISSVGGRFALYGHGAYCASKYALEAFSDTLRTELKPWNIDTICIEPARTDTNLKQTTQSFIQPIVSELLDPKSKLPCGTEVAQIYAKRLHNMKLESGDNVNVVIQAIEDALLSSRPLTRYACGIKAGIFVHLLSHLPDEVTDKLRKYFE